MTKKINQSHKGPQFFHKPIKILRLQFWILHKHIKILRPQCNILSKSIKNWGLIPMIFLQKKKPIKRFRGSNDVSSDTHQDLEVPLNPPHEFSPTHFHSMLLFLHKPTKILGSTHFSTRVHSRPCA